VVGSVLPDTIAGLGFVFHVAEPWTSLAIVADLHALLHLSPLHTVTIALHSFVIIGPLLLLCWRFRWRARPLVVGMLAHAIVDLLTHRTWAYNHFFPLPLPPLRSVVSYTDAWFTVLEHGTLLGFVLWLFWRGRHGSSARPAPRSHADHASSIAQP
jgi:cbb3-type cytochrome oxidase subunit 3